MLVKQFKSKFHLLFDYKVSTFSQENSYLNLIKISLSVSTGTNMEEANEIIRKSGLNIIPELDLDVAAKKAVSSLVKS